MNLLDFTHSFLQSLVFTTAVETATILIVIRKIFKKSTRDVSIQKLIGIGIFASFATLPYVWYVFPSLLQPFSSAILVGEIFAVVVEAVFYVIVFPLTKKQALILSLIANVASYTLGKLI